MKAAAKSRSEKQAGKAHVGLVEALAVVALAVVGEALEDVAGDGHERLHHLREEVPGDNLVLAVGAGLAVGVGKEVPELDEVCQCTSLRTK